jgi:hypothetical protein
MWRIFLVLCVLLAAGGHAVTAQAHPGRTDSNGCHVCRTNCTEVWGIPYGFYHRHNPVRPCFDDSYDLLRRLVFFGRAEAAGLGVVQGCSAPGRATVTFTWEANAGGEAQWVDLSLFNNGFAWGTFLGAGPFARTVREYTWDGLVPNTLHYYRVNTLAVFVQGIKLLYGPWHPSDTYAFVTPVC